MGFYMAVKILRVSLLCLTVLWVGFIFANSMDNGVESGKKSSTVTVIVNEVAESVGIDEEIPESTVRNMAHFGEFAVLSLFVCADLALLSFVRSADWRRAAVTLMTSAPICCLAACVDELIQKFSAGRAAQLSDVLTDTLGAICGMAEFILFYIAIRAVKKKAAHNGDLR